MLAAADTSPMKYRTVYSTLPEARAENKSADLNLTGLVETVVRVSRMTALVTSKSSKEAVNEALFVLPTTSK